MIDGRKEREQARVSSLQNCKWSNWYTALKPRPPSNSGRYGSRGEGDHGSIYSEIRERFDGPRYDDGIYELCVSKRGGKRYVVYIGAAHREGLRSMNQRILEHCMGNSNKKELINRAMRLGYTLSVRVQNIRGSREHVYQCEDEYLERYDYAWNHRSNYRIRRSVPPR